MKLEVSSTLVFLQLSKEPVLRNLFYNNIICVKQIKVHFRSPIDLKGQDLTKFKSGTSHITHHTIHSHNTYEFEVLQNS